MKPRHVTGLRKLFSLSAVALSGLAAALLPGKAAAGDFRLYDDDIPASKTAEILRRDLSFSEKKTFRFRLPLNEQNIGKRERGYNNDLRHRRRFYKVAELSGTEDGSFELSASVFTERYRINDRKEGRDAGLYLGFVKKF